MRGPSHRFNWLRENRWRAVAFVVGSLFPLLWFGAIAEDLLEDKAFAYDATIMDWIHTWASERTDRLMHAISKAGQNWGVVPLDFAVAAFLLARRRWHTAYFWAAAIGGTALLNVAAKHQFARVRPEVWAMASEPSFSFPSGHAMASMAAMAALAALLWHTRWRSTVLIVGGVFVPLVGVSRVYLGAHYPSDVFAGWALSFGWVIGCASLMWGSLASPLSGVARPSA